EEKYDGYRILAYREGRRVTLLTRNLKDRTADFPEIAHAVGTLRAPTLLLDGEIAIFDKNGVSHFQLLQRLEEGQGDGAAQYAVFDCLYVGGRDLRSSPLAERRRALEAEVPDAPVAAALRRAAGGRVGSRQAPLRRQGWNRVHHARARRALEEVPDARPRHVTVRRAGARARRHVARARAPRADRVHVDDRRRQASSPDLPRPARGQVGPRGRVARRDERRARTSDREAALLRPRSGALQTA